MAPARWCLSRGRWAESSSPDDLLLRVGQPEFPLNLDVWQCQGIPVCAPQLRRRIASVMSRTDLLKAAEDLPSLMWGSSVSILTDNNTGDRLFVPDSGYTVRLFYAKTDHGLLLDTELEAIVSHRGIEWNMGFLIEFAATQFGTRGQTPFLGVNVVPPGCALLVSTAGDTHVTQKFWPKPTATTQTVRCEDAIAEVYDHVVATSPNLTLALSGGVDSSASGIFARKAIGANTPLKAVHLYTSLSPDYHEKAFAEKIAADIDAELIPIDVEGCLPFSEIEPKTLPPALSQELMFLGANRALQQAVGHDATILEGEGGDLLFHAVPDIDVIDDAFRDGGVSLALRTCLRLARLHNGSVPRLLAQAMSRRLSLPRGPGADTRQVGAANELFGDTPRNFGNRSSLSAYAARDREILKALDSLLEVTAPVGRSGIRRINPFLAPPVVVSALALKSYESFSERNDRIILRRLASKYSASKVLWRKTKGSFDAGVLRGLQVHRENYLDLLESGVFLSNGVIAKEVVVSAFKKVDVGQSSTGITLALLGCVEIYCAAWARKIAQRSVRKLRANELKTGSI